MPNHTRLATTIAAVVAVLVTGCSASSEPGDDLSYDRSGYPPNREATGDPAALVSERGGGAVDLGGTVVVQACDVVTLQDVAAAGLSTRASTAAGTVSRDFLDGQGRAPLPSDPISLVDEANTCRYSLGRDGAPASVEVKVHQPAYVGQFAIDAELRLRHRPVADLGPVQVFEATHDISEFITRWLHYRGVYVELTTSASDGQRRIILEGAAARLPRLAATPSGPPRFGYDSPIFPVEYVNACEISTADDFRLLFDTEPSPSVHEAISPGIGRIYFPEANYLEANYVSHSCQRHTVETFVFGSVLQVYTKTFDSLDGAAAWYAFSHGFDGGVDTPVRLADESFAGISLDDETIVFRTGLTVVDVSLSAGPRQLGRSDHEALTPIAAAIAERLARRG